MSLLSHKKILITGTGGFIGSHVLHHFLEAGHDAYGIDKHAIPQNTLQDSKRHITADLSRTGQIRGILSKLGPSCIIHLASGLVDVEESVRRPDKAIRDLSMTVRLVEAARLYGVRHVIFASSANVYGNRHTSPIQESGPISPMSPYGLTKLAIENYLQYFSRNYGVGYTILRYFNVYGPRQSITNRPAIPIFINAALSNSPVTLYGGTQLRDFIYVTDVARANEAAYLSGKSGIYNIAGGHGITINSLVRLVEKISGTPMKLTRQPMTQSNADYSVADIRKAKKDLGWSPEVDITEGIKKTVEYYRKIKK